MSFSDICSSPNYSLPDNENKNIDELSLGNNMGIFLNREIPKPVRHRTSNSPISAPQTATTNKELNNLGINIAKEENIQVEIKPKKEYKAKKTGEKEYSGKKRGRSSKGDSNDTHDKFADDNLRRKVKHILLIVLQKLINEKIRIEYNGDIGKGIFKKELLTINQEQISNATVDFNKEFLNKNLEAIFSVNITTRFTNFPKDHNKKLIEELKNKSEYFKRLFNLTFLQCLQHFRGSVTIEELNGLKRKDEALEKFKDDKNYVEYLENYFMNYEKKINKKRSRTSKKNKNKENKLEEDKGNVIIDQEKVLLYKQ